MHHGRWWQSHAQIARSHCDCSRNHHSCFSQAHKIIAIAFCNSQEVHHGPFKEHTALSCTLQSSSQPHHATHRPHRDCFLKVCGCNMITFTSLKEHGGSWVQCFASESSHLKGRGSGAESWGSFRVFLRQKPWRLAGQKLECFHPNLRRNQAG